MLRHLASILVLLLTASISSARTSADVSAVLNSSALKPGQTAIIAVVVDVHAGLHAQSHQPLDPTLIPLDLTMDANPAVDFDAPIFPQGKIESYAALGKLSVYTGKTIVFVRAHVKAGAPPGPITLTGHLTFQACNESSCFAPEHPTVSLDSTITGPNDAVTPANAELFSDVPQAAPATRPATQPAAVPPATKVAGGATIVTLFGRSFDLAEHPYLSVLIAFLAGIIFNVVPCVLPVLPVKAVGFYEASQHSRARSLLLGFVFSLGLVAIFAALGMVVLLSKSLFGSQITWGQQFSYPWFVWTVAIVLAALGFGMLGAFNVNLPTSIYGLDFRHDTLSGNFLWGSLTAVLSTPCTAPLFPPVLGFALTLPRLEGFLLVTTVGCGMASPYLLLSAFPEAARKFPRTGAFAELVKQMMGFLMLGSAAFFAGLELVGEPNQWWIVFAVVVWACIYLVARTTQISKSSTAMFIVSALAVAITASALVISLRLTDALPHSRADAADAVQWQPYSPDALAAARQAKKIVIVDFTANWCLNCKYVEATVYHDPRTLAALKQMDVVMMKADLTNHDAPGWPLLNELKSDGIPFTAVYFPGSQQPVGLASIYTTQTLLHVIGADAIAQATANDLDEK